MKIMTEEYCQQCPFFIKEKGWMEDDHPYWKKHPDAKCMCETCPRKEICETEGPTQDLLVCFSENKDYLDKKVTESLKGDKNGRGKN